MRTTIVNEVWPFLSELGLLAISRIYLYLTLAMTARARDDVGDLGLESREMRSSWSSVLRYSARSLN